MKAERAQAQKLAASGQLYDKLRSLQILQKRLEELQAYRKNGAPWQIGLGLYQGKELEPQLRREYFAGLKDVMLRPVQRNLETTLVALKPEAPAPAPVVSEPAKPAVAAPAPAPFKPSPRSTRRAEACPISSSACWIGRNAPPRPSWTRPRLKAKPPRRSAIRSSWTPATTR